MTRISVGVRLKPEEPQNLSKNIVVEGNNSMDISNLHGIEVTAAGTKHEFQFDNIFPGHCTQEQVFRSSTNTIIDDVLDGFNGCVLTYGQTGAGKTYTMSGPSSEAYEERGLVMRTASAIFQKCSQISDSITVRLSVLEIYNETLVDLLREPSPANQTNNNAPTAPKLSIIEGSGGISIPALYVLPISCEEDAFSILLEAYGNRVVAEHQLNRKSSRSHVIYTFYITRTRSEDDIVQSKLNLVDLAGSERVQKTGSSGLVQKEASYINKSLSFLEQVVLALSQSKRDHIPYRQSKLTYILKDSLGGNCATYLIACIWTNQLHEWETLSTLRFATRMKCIENHPIRNNLVSKEPLSGRLLQQIEQLKREIVMRDTMNRSDPWMPELSKAQRLKAIRAISAVAMDRPNAHEIAVPSEDIDINSISQCRLMFGFLRLCLWESCNGDVDKVQAIVSKVSVDSGNHNGITAVNYNNNSNNNNNNTNNNNNNNNNLQNENTNIENTSSNIDENEDNSDRNKQTETEISYNNSNSNENNNNNNNNNSNVSMTFDEFSHGIGSELFESYSVAKESLKSNKMRQKQIVSILNSRKLQIDQISESIKEKAESDVSDDVGDLEAQLDMHKKEYRAAYTELQLCKKQVLELETLKQRAQTALLKAFEDYSNGGNDRSNGVIAE